MSKKKINHILSFLNGAIDRKKSNIFSFKASRLNFKKKIDSLDNSPKNLRIKKLGGNSLSKKSFVDAIRHRTGSWGGIAGAALKVTENDLAKGAKSIRKLKKQRKNIATGRVKFARIRGRVVPIRSKK